nr:DUF5710 domain-containing protein [uncultured Massilia sp.]
MPQAEMTFLNVPYAEKDEARALGARWNPGRKRWYVPTGVALEPFEKWLAKDGAPAGGGGGSGRKDSAVAKLAVGANYVELAHDCNPFEPCPTCAAELAGTPWTAARAALLDAVANLKRGR